MPASVQEATSPTPTLALYKDYAFNEYLYVHTNYSSTLLDSLGPYARVISTDALTQVQQIQVTFTGHLSIDELEHLNDYRIAVFDRTSSYYTTEDGVQAKYGGDTGLAFYQFAEAQLKKSGRIKDPERGVFSDINTGFSMVGRAIADGFRQDIYNTQEASNAFTSISSILPFVTTFQNISQSLLEVVRYYNDDVMEGNSYIPGGIAFGLTVGMGVASTLYSGLAVTVGALVALPLLVMAAGAQLAGYDAKNNLPLPLIAQDLRLLIGTTLQIGAELILKPVAYATEGEFSAAGAQVLGAMGWDPNSDEKFVKAAEVGIFVGSALAIPTGLGIRKVNRYRAIRAEQNLIEHTLVTSQGEVPVTFKPSGGWIRPFTLKPTTRLAPEVLADPNVKVINLLHPKRGNIWLRQIEGKPKWKLIPKEAPLPDWGSFAKTWSHEWTPRNAVISGQDVSILRLRLRLHGKGYHSYLTPLRNTEPPLVTALANEPRKVITLQDYRFVKPKRESNFYWDGKKPEKVGSPTPPPPPAPPPPPPPPPPPSAPLASQVKVVKAHFFHWNDPDVYIRLKVGWFKWVRVVFRAINDHQGQWAYTIDRSKTPRHVVTQAAGRDFSLSVSYHGNSTQIFYKETSASGPIWRTPESIALDSPPPPWTP